jgi:hypothetical protein
VQRNREVRVVEAVLLASNAEGFYTINPATTLNL